MSRIPLRYYHWTYVWIPLATAAMWFSTLLAMLVVWLASGRPKYVSQEGSIAYISDVGAGNLKPLFITGCAITGFGLFLTLVTGRLLRHTGRCATTSPKRDYDDGGPRLMRFGDPAYRLMPNMRNRERVFSVLAIIGAFIGACGLLFLSIFDTKRHPSVHRACLLLFIVGVALSAIFAIIEYWWVSRDFDGYKELQIAYIAKAIIATILIILAIAFGITLYHAQDVGAVLEWVIAFGFTLYILSFYYDLRLSKNHQKGELKLLAHPSRAEGATSSFPTREDHDMREVIA